MSEGLETCLEIELPDRHLGVLRQSATATELSGVRAVPVVSDRWEREQAVSPRAERDLPPRSKTLTGGTPPFISGIDLLGGAAGFDHSHQPIDLLECLEITPYD